MTKNMIFRISALLIVLVTAAVYFIRQEVDKGSSTLQSEVTITPAVSRITSSASWVSTAETVSELALESDIIVRARVSGAPVTRVLRRELSVFDENNNIVGSTIYEALFSDTTFEITKTYLGEPLLSIVVMQTGGFDPAKNRVEEVIDDPLYKIGEEYVLFLVDISGDRVQAPDRELYVIVHPFGRYEIKGESVSSFGQNPTMDTFSVAPNISDLESQIEKAISLLSTSTELLIETLTPSPTETTTPTP